MMLCQSKEKRMKCLTCHYTECRVFVMLLSIGKGRGWLELPQCLCLLSLTVKISRIKQKGFIYPNIRPDQQHFLFHSLLPFFLPCCLFFNISFFLLSLSSFPSFQFFTLYYPSFLSVSSFIISTFLSFSYLSIPSLLFNSFFLTILLSLMSLLS